MAVTENYIVIFSVDCSRHLVISFA